MVGIPSSDERDWICGYPELPGSTRSTKNNLPLSVGTILIIPQHFENVANKWNKAKYAVQKENWFLLCL